MIGTIYKYTFADNKIYIGQTRRPMEKRHREHLDNTSGPLNPRFWDAYQRLGEPTLEILEQYESSNEEELIEVLNYVETNYIIESKSYLPEYGYNVRPVATEGSGARKILEEAILDLTKELFKPHKKYLEDIYNKVVVTKDPLTEEEIKFIKEILFEDDLYGMRDSGFDCNNLHKNDEHTLFFFSEALEDFMWGVKLDLENEARQFVYENSSQIINAKNEDKIIVQLDLEGNIVKEYPSLNEVAHELNLVRPDNIRNVLWGKQKTAYGYKWTYKSQLKNKI